ncbi:alpha/beta fold hydrolase [Clostridium arbusti]|uniref:alpha/beta fold hydrolase n=1 Tax=Clostridium arbusti TaxID=1137848 RepID=UPI000288A36F|nr:alpha/beta hydrolase [Clostridium arbusti]
MIFKCFGDKRNPVIILIHGAGLSYWMWKPEIQAFKDKYYIVTPILDGNGDAANVTFHSIEKCAKEIIDYIEQNFNGKVFAICGISTGAETIVEILSKNPNIAKKAIIESAIVIPIRVTEKLSKIFVTLTYFLIKRKWFSKLLAKQICIPKSMFQNYYVDGNKISKQSIINMITAYFRYTLPTNFKNNKADIIVMCGNREYSSMKKSAELIHKNSINSKFIIIPQCGHGISIKLPETFIEIMKKLFEDNKS